jgi:hypothetical protein
MQEFQTNKQDLNQTRLVKVAKQSIHAGQGPLNTARYAFTANTLT